MKQSDQLKKELYDMVYMWGRVGFKNEDANETSPAFKAMFEKILAALRLEELEIEGDAMYKDFLDDGDKSFDSYTDNELAGSN